jgi:hypothetical protein
MATTMATTGQLRLQIAGGPADRISLDGREIARGVSTVDFGEVAPGPHLVSVEAAGRAVQNTPVNVVAGAPAMLTVALGPAVEPAARPGARHAAFHPPAGAQGKATGGETEKLAPPPKKPSRAEEHGLIDENPFRKP